MTGLEHYRAAEQLLRSCQVGAITLDSQTDTAEAYPAAIEDGADALAAAQVHATLALAAATDRGLARMRPATDGLAPG